jgi:hypothetical protein
MTLTVEPVGREPGQRPRVSPGRLAGSTVRVGNNSEVQNEVQGSRRDVSCEDEYRVLGRARGRLPGVSSMAPGTSIVRVGQSTQPWPASRPLMENMTAQRSAPGMAGCVDRLTDREPPSTHWHPILGWPVGVGVQAPVTRAWPVGGRAVLRRERRARLGAAAGRDRQERSKGARSSARGVRMLARAMAGDYASLAPRHLFLGGD